jgi:hypothetical protein
LTLLLLQVPFLALVLARTKTMGMKTTPRMEMTPMMTQMERKLRVKVLKRKEKSLNSRTKRTMKTSKDCFVPEGVEVQFVLLRFPP